MSDIASRLQVAQADSQLPVSWYFDEKIFNWRNVLSSMPLRLRRTRADGTRTE